MSISEEKATFDDIIWEHENHLNFIKRSFDHLDKKYLKGMFEGLQREFRSAKFVCSNEEIFETRECTDEEKKKFKYKPRTLSLSYMLIYRNKIVPIYFDDYGQQFMMVYNKKEFSGGAFNSYCDFDFTCMLDDEIDDEILGKEIIKKFREIKIFR